MLKFEHPEYLWGLLALPVMAIALSMLYRRQKSLLARVVSLSLLSELAPEKSGGKKAIKYTFLLLGTAFLLLAFANPQVGTRLEEIKREGIDLFVALDVSLSMKAEDIRPNRLDKAKRDVSNLFRKLQGDRVGMIVFAGDAFVQFPLTSDYSAADLFISAVDVDAVPVPGTMIGIAIEKALKSFSSDLPTQKAVFIVSDGENTEGNIIGAIEQANKDGVRIYCVGMGTTEGGPIPIYNAGGERVDYKRDRTGSIVLTKLDESTLQQISTATGGSYRRATSGGNEIDDIFKELASLEKIEFGAKHVTGFESLYQYPLAFAFLFLMIEFMLSERRGGLLRRLKGLLPATQLMLVMLCSYGIAEAQTVRSLVKEGNSDYESGKYTDAEVAYRKALQRDPTSPHGLFNLGDAFYKQQRYNEAMKSFGMYAATNKDAHAQAKAYHNVGNSLFKSDKIGQSIEAYKQALRLNPADEETRYNLQLAKEKLKQQQNQKQNKQDQKKEDQQKQDQQQKQEQQNQQQNRQQPQQQQAQPQTAQKNQIPKEQADRILETLQNSDKEIQKQIRKRAAVRIRTEKDW